MGFGRGATGNLGMRGSEKAEKRISRYPHRGLLLVRKLVLPDPVSVDCGFSVALAHFSYPHLLGTVCEWCKCVDGPSPSP